MKKLKLGIIGMSEGNGHPYSWSAIFNGYDLVAMGKCPFPVILDYLSKQSFPNDTIKNATVTHIWTQDISISKKIAHASKIQNIVKNFDEMIPEVDAVLLARDDGENHFEMARAFIKAGLPIYIDKPLALTVAEVNKIFSLEKYENQIFSCSALSFSKELQMSDKILKKIGKITHINAVIAKDWDKYAIHIIDPVLHMLDSVRKIETTRSIKSASQNLLSVKWENGLTANFVTLGTCPTPITIEVYGNKGFHIFTFNDTFSAFKSTLQKFVNIVNKKDKVPNRNLTMQSIQLLEAINYE